MLREDIKDCDQCLERILRTVINLLREDIKDCDQFA